METTNSKGETVYKFVPTEVAKEWEPEEMVASDGLDLYHWQGTHWQKLDDLDAQALAMTKLLELFAPAPWLATVANARHSVAAAKLYLLDKMPMGDRTWHDTIPVQNGYLDFASRGLMDANKEDWMQHYLACDYNPAASADRFAEYLEFALPDPEVRERVQEYVGSCLIARSFDRHQLWHGAASHVLAKILGQFFGNAAIGYTSDELEQYRLSTLVTEAAGYTTTRRKAAVADLIKDGMGARRSKVNARYNVPALIQVAGKNIAMGDLIPPLTDPSAPYWKTWDAVTFHDAPDCSDYVLECELSGVLNWALEGLQRLDERGGFGLRPEGVLPIITVAKNDESSLVAWTDECNVQLKNGAKTLKSEVYESYRAWAQRHDLRPLGVIQFWTKAKQNVFGDALDTQGKKMVNGREKRTANLEIGG